MAPREVFAALERAEVLLLSRLKPYGVNRIEYRPHVGDWVTIHGWVDCIEAVARTLSVDPDVELFLATDQGGYGTVPPGASGEVIAGIVTDVVQPI